MQTGNTQHHPPGRSIKLSRPFGNHSASERFCSRYLPRKKNNLSPKSFRRQSIISTIRHFYVPPKSATELACHPAYVDIVAAAAAVDDAAAAVTVSGTSLQSSPLESPSNGSNPGTSTIRS